MEHSLLMKRIFFVIPDLQYGGSVNQACLLATGLARAHLAIKVCALGEDGPLKNQLCEEGVEVEVLGWKTMFDPRPWTRLRNAIQAFSPHVIHAWELSALRAVQLTASRNGSKLIAHACVPSG